MNVADHQLLFAHAHWSSSRRCCTTTANRMCSMFHVDGSASCGSDDYISINKTILRRMARRPIPEHGDDFAFANGEDDEVVATLPANATAVFYQGFRVSGGALYLACLNCIAGGEQRFLEVDAHDPTDNGTQPPTVLFSFTGLDPTVAHDLSVFNLEDDRFDHTSQITFDALVVTVLAPQMTPMPQRPGRTGTVVTSTSSISTAIHSVPTATATQDPSSTGTASGSASQSTATTPSSGVSQSSTSRMSPLTTSTSPTSSTSRQSPSVTSSSQTPQTATTSNPPPQTSTSPTVTTTSLGPSTSISSENSTSGGATSASPDSSSTGPANTSSAASNGGKRTASLSTTVIAVVAVVSAVGVLLLLLGVIFAMRRARRRQMQVDVEGSAALMRGLTPSPIQNISGPLDIAPVRPRNPFEDQVQPTVHIDTPGSHLTPPPHPRVRPPLYRRRAR
ncbi:hypothetical protein A0H81_00605 [Grifola frondosa]|uniref:Uncharacterized protein n=1 Tax=Grifola frondosa TaxID=5627 RepID=A0A1C7MPJ9_GRIFR|nr:hypothetical protein A0H81_00605 [Grifola frondosa]